MSSNAFKFYVGCAHLLIYSCENGDFDSDGKVFHRYKAFFMKPFLGKTQLQIHAWKTTVIPDPKWSDDKEREERGSCPPTCARRRHFNCPFKKEKTLPEKKKKKKRKIHMQNFTKKKEKMFRIRLEHKGRWSKPLMIKIAQYKRDPHQILCKKSTSAILNQHAYQ